jgi:hypothetical protein
VHQSKCRSFATSEHQYIGNKQINDDLGVLFFAKRIRSLTKRFESELDDL